MRRDNKDGALNEHQVFVLESFIKHFLPKRGNKRKHSGNELDYVTKIIDRIIKQNFGFNLTYSNVLNAFIKLDYVIFHKNGEWDPDTKRYNPSVTGYTTRGGDAYSTSEVMYIYIDIDPKILRELKLATLGLPPNAGEPKIILKQQQQERINSFKKVVQPD